MDTFPDGVVPNFHSPHLKIWDIPFLSESGFQNGRGHTVQHQPLEYISMHLAQLLISPEL